MSFFIFPSSKKPQFYFSDSNNVLTFFIYNFLYSRNTKIQFLLNTIKSTAPDSFLCLLLKIIIKKGRNLPYTLSGTVDNLLSFIKNNRKIFLPNTEYVKDITFIIRTSKWQRATDKFVIIFFCNSNKQPFVVAKIGSLENPDAVRREFTNCQKVYNYFRETNTAFIPEPLTLLNTDKTITYFERILGGIPFNDYLKTIFRKNTKHNLYIQVSKKCKDFLINLHRQNQDLTSEDFYKYFYEPLDYFKKTILGQKHPSRLHKLKEQVDDMQNRGLHSVWMHGDFWTGSILYNGENIGVIDWEFFSERGVPLWDFFSLVFHIGGEVNYFTDNRLSAEVDNCITDLSNIAKINTDHIRFIFQSFLIFNVKNRDTVNEKYWQNFLEYYWNRIDSGKNNVSNLL